MKDVDVPGTKEGPPNLVDEGHNRLPAAGTVVELLAVGPQFVARPLRHCPEAEHREQGSCLGKHQGNKSLGGYVPTRAALLLENSRYFTINRLTLVLVYLSSKNQLLKFSLVRDDLVFC